MLQLEQEGLAVLDVQRLDISQTGLLRLKLFQNAGNLLLQALEVRQSTEVSLRHSARYRTLLKPVRFTWVAHFACTTLIKDGT